MRGIYTPVTDIRRKVFTEVARMAYEVNELSDYEKLMRELPFKIIPGEEKSRGSMQALPPTSSMNNGVATINTNQTISALHRFPSQAPSVTSTMSPVLCPGALTSTGRYCFV